VSFSTLQKDDRNENYYLEIQIAVGIIAGGEGGFCITSVSYIGRKLSQLLPVFYLQISNPFPIPSQIYLAIRRKK
jgi:hypothetical protein